MASQKIDPRRLSHPNLDQSNLPHILPDTRDYLDLCAKPDLLEHLTTEQIHKLFERDGYEHGSVGDITVGIARKLGDAYIDAPNACAFITANDQLVYLQFGTSSLYSLGVVAEHSQGSDRAFLLHKLTDLESSIIPVQWSKKLLSLKAELDKALSEKLFEPYTIKDSEEKLEEEPKEYIPRCGPNPGYFG